MEEKTNYGTYLKAYTMLFMGGVRVVNKDTKEPLDEGKDNYLVAAIAIRDYNKGVLLTKIEFDKQYESMLKVE